MFSYIEFFIFILVTYLSSLHIYIIQMYDLRSEFTFQKPFYNFNKFRNIIYWVLYCIFLILTNNNKLLKTYYFIFLYNYTHYKYFNSYVTLWLISIIFNTKFLHLITPAIFILIE